MKPASTNKTNFRLPRPLVYFVSFASPTFEPTTGVFEPGISTEQVRFFDAPRSFNLDPSQLLGSLLSHSLYLTLW